jgi:dipeptidyl aminopeptidase/acylaminoacyl peptidase
MIACGYAPRLATTTPVIITETIPAITNTLPAPQVRVTVLPTETPTSEPTPTSTPTISATPDPYEHYTIDHLAGREYGGGEVRIEETLAVNSYFTRTLITYPSDGLTIYGFMNTPRRASENPDQPLPVVIALHGYIEPSIYTTLDYTTGYADALARAGFLVLHPNLRGYSPSDDGDNLFRVGMAVDVLNLISLVRQQAGKPGPLERANPDAIGLWGHSMGGGITTRVITVSPHVRAAVLYGAMSGDERLNYERIFSYFSNGTRGLEELSAPEEAFLRISPINALDRIQAAVSIHHGEQDQDVPLAWSQDTCQRLEELGKTVECYTYEGQPHTFQGEGYDLFIQRVIAFFSERLR